MCMQLTNMLRVAVHRSKHARSDTEQRLADNHCGMKITGALSLF